MCDYIEKMLSYLAPIIVDLDDQKKRLDCERENYEEVVAFLLFVNNDVNLVSKYEDQEFIKKYLEKVGSNYQEYQANVYLLDSSNDNIKNLPQFGLALTYMKKLIDYFNVMREVLNLRVNELGEIYVQKFIANKYHNIFSQENVFVDNVDEFCEFLYSLDLSLEDKKELLMYTVRSNVKRYREGVKNEELEIDREHDMMRVHEIIHQNKLLLGNDYLELLDLVSHHIDLSLDIRETIDEEILEKINVNNLLLAKQIWLIKKITSNYKSCEFAKVSKFVHEYESVVDLKEKVKSCDDKKEIIKIIKGGY